MTAREAEYVSRIHKIYQDIESDTELLVISREIATEHLYRAIEGIARPERFTYPKTRRGTKGAPIVRR